LIISNKTKIPFLCIALTLLLSNASYTAGEDIKTKAASAVKGLKDLTLTCIVTYSNPKELKKISKDFSKRYEFKKSTIKYKSPDMFKMEGSLGLIKGRIVFNGDRKALVIPGIGVNKKDDLKKDPHKRQSDLDIGIFSDSLWKHYIVKNAETVPGANGAEYKITFVRSNAKSKNITCWVTSDTMKLRKLEKYESDGSMKSRFIYTDHKKINNSIWIPMKINIYNGNGKLAASTEYKDVKINTGISNSEFKL
jgi:outer membrane lipoprotein-sorting protein